MRCIALLFNLEILPNKKKPGAFNRFLTFVDTDTGDSFRTYVDELVGSQFVKMKTVDMVLSIAQGEFNGKPQLDVRVISMTDYKEPEAKAADAKPVSSFPGSKT
jgi:hypothetical protein